MILQILKVRFALNCVLAEMCLAVLDGLRNRRLKILDELDRIIAEMDVS